MSDLNTSWHSYPSIYNLGHKNVLDIFNEDVLIEEKIDGSQFSFGLFADELRCRSKGATLNIDAPEKMFQKAVDVAKGLIDKLNNGWTYRCEYLPSFCRRKQKPLMQKVYTKKLLLKRMKKWTSLLIN
jgi:hypothetical protein